MKNQSDILNQPLIINLAPTGCISTKLQSPHIPLTHSEIVENVAESMDIGVQMVHLHTRGKDGEHCPEPEPYGRVIESLRKLPGGRELVICITTSGRHEPAFESRARVLDLDGDMKPDMASLTLSSLNFMHSASVNQPETIRRLAARMLERGIKPELEIFDLGMVNMADVLVKEGLIQGPVYANVLLGNIASAQASLMHVSSILGSMPDNWIISLAGIGRSQLTANILGVLYADGIRLGLEDNIWLDDSRKILATNSELVKRIVRIAKESGRDLMNKVDVRKLLALETL